MIKINEQFLTEFIKLAVKIHDDVVLMSGGLLGTKNLGLLESAVSNLAYYDTFDEQLTNLIFSIAKNHAFNDGNKRASIAVSAYFLIIANYPTFIISKFIEDMEDIILMVVCGFITKEELGEFVVLIINDLPFYDELQLKWILAKQKIDALYGE